MARIMEMTPDQFAQLLNLLGKMADRTYTITGAADWPILAVIGSILVGLLGFMWVDLRSTLKDNRSEWREELEKHKAENEKGHDLLWDAMRDCKSDCCPARKGNG